MNQKDLHKKIEEISKTIFSYCMLRTSSREDAEDLAQDILLAIMKSAENIRDDAAFYGFMWSVAGNVYKAWYRKKIKNTEVPLDEITENTIPDEENGFGALFEEDSELYLLRRELTLLAKKYRDATILYYMENKSCEEIAALLSTSESMVKYLLFKSRKILKEGLTMERKLGKLSYQPKTLLPMYSGTGINHFYDFMNKKIRQNIIAACYNDLLTPEQISLEIGIPLPYLDDEIEELEEKRILLREGARYKTNIVIVSSECKEEVSRIAAGYCEKIYAKMAEFLKDNMSTYQAMNFTGADFSENTRRFQLLTLLVRAFLATGGKRFAMPETAWGGRAHLWCEEPSENSAASFAYSGMNGKDGDMLLFLDYLPAKKGDHHDFFGNDRKIGILLDIAKGKTDAFSEYDKEAIAQMIQKGYVVSENGSLRVTLPVYTKKQYEELWDMAAGFVKENLLPIAEEIDAAAEKIMRNHTPRHLHDKLPPIVAINRFHRTTAIPVQMLVEKGVLSTAYHPLEMPTCFIVLHD